MAKGNGIRGKRREKREMGLENCYSSVDPGSHIAVDGKSKGNYQPIRHFQENIQFCRISRGSLYENQDHLITCLDNAYISKEEFNEIWALTESAIRVGDGYIRYLNRQAMTASKPKRSRK